MTWLRRTLRRLIWWREPVWVQQRHRSRTHLPHRLRPHVIYVVGEPPKWAVLRCPCGAGHRIDLALAPHGPWSVDDQETPTLHPSIDVREDVRCHFWLRSGRVTWC